ncbi:hypothetical protein BN1356_01683 [Streptococcus varani]|uniref:Uncharacterized protein n=1 Tax=Streptococcus varani TaxID=1608583 RepID=A0A0E3WFE0_9STRE|nr:hypothetical protein [Streptococcus varani]CQR25342.1 hypothetical protein BN1356_01683 [Streptococcus varani]
MKKMKFDFIALFVGGCFFFIYLMMFEKSFFEFPQIIGTLYFFVCMICFSLVLDHFENESSSKLPAIFYRLIYLGLFAISPIYFIYLILQSKDKNE